LFEPLQGPKGVWKERDADSRSLGERFSRFGEIFPPELSETFYNAIEAGRILKVGVNRIWTSKGPYESGAQASSMSRSASS
jgi:hypothetical protein